MVLLLAAGCMAESRPPVEVTRASWGYAGSRKDVRDDLAELCRGRSSCSFVVNNQLFALHPPSDPSPGDDKGLIVTWKCGGTLRKYEFAENRKAILACD